MGIICVTGSGRDGTSLMMQTLKILGVPVAAPDFIKEHDKIRQFNPKGFYELPDLEHGIKDDRYDGMAVKMFPATLENTPKELIGKIIRMSRNPTDAAISYCPLKDVLEDTKLSAFEIIKFNNSYLDKYLLERNHILVKFEHFLENPFDVIEMVIDYLDITPSLSQIADAYRNIDTIQIK